MSTTGSEPVQAADLEPSLTNYVECIKVDKLCATGPNDFAVFRHQNTPPTLQRLFAAIGAYHGSYILYKAVENNENFTLTIVLFDSFPERNSIYFAVDSEILCENLGKRLYDIWQQKQGLQGKYPIQLPSRGRVFRTS